MTLVRMLPPPGRTNVRYGLRPVGPDGIDVTERDAAGLEKSGWTRDAEEPAQTKPKKRRAKPAAKPEEG